MWTMKKNEQIEKEIIHTAIDNLEKNTGLKADWRAGKIKDLDGELHIQWANKTMKFLVEAKKEITNYNLTKLIDKTTDYDNLLIIAHKILPGIKEELRQRHIPYLEGNGNIFIDKPPVYIWLDHNKPLDLPREKPNRAFTRAGLQTVYLFLTEPAYINKTYREIAKNADVALGNISNVINGLLDLGFLVRLNKDELALHNKKTLFEKWATAYEEKLKPTLHVGNFRFIQKNQEPNWRDIGINYNETVWGGEPGGDLLTNHLRPEILTLYTSKTRRELLDGLRIVPDETGDIKVYKKFWTTNPPILTKETPRFQGDKAAHPFIIYADLMNTNNKRCIETAKIIYERDIEPNL
jgi:hypothetical protein